MNVFQYPNSDAEFAHETERGFKDFASKSKQRPRRSLPSGTERHP